MSNGETPKNDSPLSREDEAQIKQITRQERLIKIGLGIVGLGMIAVISLFVYNYIQARTGEPKRYFEFQLETLKSWQDVVRKNPKSSSAHNNLGFAYLKMGREGKAIAEFKRAIKYDRKNADPYLQLGKLYFQIGQKDRSIPYLKKAAKYAPEGGRALAYFTLGQIYEEKNDKSKAFDYYTKSSEDEPLMWNAHYKLAQFLERDGKKDLALEEYKQAETFNPGNQAIKKAIERLSK